MDPNSKAYSPTTSDAEMASEKMAIQQPDEASHRNSEAILEAIKHKKHVKDWDGSGVDFSQVDEKKTLKKMVSKAGLKTYKLQSDVNITL